MKEAVLDSAIVDIVLGPEYALGESHPVIVTKRDNGEHIRVLSYIPVIPLLQGGGSS